jgi:hypothetical protein
MRELVLVDGIKIKGVTVHSLKWKDGVQTWTVDTAQGGAYVLRAEGEDAFEYVVPPTGVKYEKRSRPKAETAKRS